MRASSIAPRKASCLTLASSPAARGPAAAERAPAPEKPPPPKEPPPPPPLPDQPPPPQEPPPQWLLSRRGPRRSYVRPVGICRAPWLASHSSRTTKNRMIRIATSGTPAAVVGGGALYSPRVAARMPSMPASRPPAQSPARKRGRTSWSRMRAASWSGSAPFEAVAGLDPHLAVVHEHEQDRPVVPVLAPHAPRLGDADREVLERRRRQALEDRHHDLGGGLFGEASELRVEPLRVARGDEARVVVEVRRGRGRQRLRPEPGDAQDEDDADDERAQEGAHPGLPRV